MRKAADQAGASDNRIHVLTMVDGIGTHGGGESLARQIAQGLDPDRFVSTFCVTRWVPMPEFDGALAELEATNTDFIGMTRSSRFDLRPWTHLAREIRRRNVDVLHTHKIGSNIWGAILSAWTRVPVFIAHEHTWSFEGNWPRKFLDRELIARRADAFVAVSAEDRRRMAEIERIPERKLRFIQNGIPEMRPPNPAADPRAEFGIAADAPLIGAVTTLRPQKALDVLIRAAAVLSGEFPNLRVLIIGGSPERVEGEEERRLKGLVNELGLEDIVIFAGLRSDIPDLLAAIDVAVLSSDYEGSPLSILEYMQAGKPIVSTSVGGISDLIENEITGLLVEPRDQMALADRIGRVLREPELAHRLAQAAKQAQSTHFTIGATTRNIENLYAELYQAKAIR